MTVALEEIFDKERLPSYIDWFPLFFYTPLGITLAIVRFFIGIHALLLSTIFTKMPRLRRYILRIMCIVLGFIVITESYENYDKNAKILVANHVTNFDHLAVNLLISTVVPSVWDLPPYLNWLLGYTDFGASEGRQVLIQNVSHFIKGSKVPVLVFPEGATTNNKKGLLKFGYWPFMLNYPVQPVTLKVTRPSLMKIAPSILGSRWWSDMFWFLFVPYTAFTVRFLPMMDKKESETAANFCNKVQKRMCKDLGLEETNFTSSDKVEYAKYVLHIATSE